MEEAANESIEDEFVRKGVLLIVDGTDPEFVRSILETELSCISDRHKGVISFWDSLGSMGPAWGMIGTLIGLINMLKGMDMESGASSLGSDMGTALITTLYGCILAHMIFGPIASLLRNRDEKEVLCKMIIIEGIMSIQSGENPKFLKERLLTYMSQKQRMLAENGGKAGKGSKGKKGKGGASADAEAA